MLRTPARGSSRTAAGPRRMSTAVAGPAQQRAATVRRRGAVTAPAAVADAAAAEPAHLARIIDGKAVADALRREVGEKVAAMKAATGKARSCPVLLLRLFLTRAPQDSETYVRNKKKACAECGIASFGADLPATATEAEVLAAITLFNADPAVHGVLVQLPLPSHISEERVLAAISLEKDVDGFHPLNVGRLHMRGRAPLFVPCTPKGVIELLVRSGVAVAGARAVVVGRSNIVGAPAAALLQRLDATVTVVHSRTERPEEVVRQADIVVAAMGVPGFVRGAWLKPGCAVIDVGINAVPDASRKTGYRLVGDVAYDEAVLVAGLITPVPGGVGPMTIACLLANTLEGAQRALGWTG